MRGAAVLVISEDLDELFALADRFLVIHAGDITDAGPSEALDRADRRPDDGRARSRGRAA